MKLRPLAAALALSAALHAGIPAGVHIETEYRPIRRAVAALKSHQDRMLIRSQRKGLFEAAHAAMKAKVLSMGEFILRANHLDALESGREFDMDAARAEYTRILGAVKRELSGGAALSDALPKALRDFDYAGTPGGWMAEMLLNKAGSCVPSSHLAAAIGYDAGMGGYMYFRNYAPNERGLAHLAPIIRSIDYEGVEGEHDVMSGKNSNKSGTLFHITSLIKLYGIKHGFVEKDSEFSAQEIAGMRASPDEGDSFVYPPAMGSFSGAMPVFSERVYGEPDYSDGGSMPTALDTKARKEACGPVPLSYLDPVPARPKGWPEGYHHVVPLSPSTKEEISRMSGCAESVKDALAKEADPLRRMILYGKLAGYYTAIAFNLDISGRFKLARIAEKERDNAIESGRAELLKADKGGFGTADSDAFRRAFLKSQDGASLAFLEEPGLTTLIRIMAFSEAVRRAPKRKWNYEVGETEDLAASALIAHPGSREITGIHKMKRYTSAEIMYNLLRNRVVLGDETTFEGIYSAYSAAMDAGGWTAYKSYQDYLQHRSPKEMRANLNAALKGFGVGEERAGHLLRISYWLLLDQEKTLSAAQSLRVGLLRLRLRLQGQDLDINKAEKEIQDIDGEMDRIKRISGRDRDEMNSLFPPAKPARPSPRR